MAQRISFLEESLALPARNAGLFAPVVALTFAHTFVFLSVAVLRVHPLAAAVLLRLDARERNADPGYATDDEIRERGKMLALLYLAYLASKLATQVSAVLAASVTHSGERSKYRTRRAPFFVAVAFVATLELASAALLALASWSWWGRAGHSGGAGASSSSVCLLLALLLHLCLGAVLPVSIAASSAVAAAEEDCGVGALRRVWRLVAARGKEAFVLALAASLLPGVAIYPVYALVLEFAQSRAAIVTFDLELARSDTVWVLGVMYVYLLPAVGAQLYSTVAATVFYRRCVERHHEPTIPLTMNQ
ncbi:hypothetical protein VPH35_054999 [Triticum aestivum]|uniref:Uncharacterized protein n=1 Tax=Triticum aestivum TaxID=4565 RepID=A0A077RYG5_WHEAT|nr:unnamed protein product [Triticum aestivum]